MATLNFPSSPSLNQIYSANNKSWIWDGVAWNPYGGTSSAMILLASATASSSAEILFDNVFNSSLYSKYVLEMQGVQPATDNVAFRLQLRNSTPASITHSHQNNRLAAQVTGIALGNNGSLGGTTGWSIFVDSGNASNELNSFTLEVMPITGQWTHMQYRGYFANAAGVPWFFCGSGACEGTTAPAGIRIYMSSGNISIGTFQLYGIKK